MNCLKGCGIEKKTGRPHDASASICRTWQDRPLIVQPDGSVKSYQRTSNFSKGLDDNLSLMGWKVEMALRGVASDPREYSVLRAIVHTDDKHKIRKKGEELQVLAGSEAKADRGTLVHGFTEALDKGEELGPIPADVVPDLHAYEYATEGIEHLLIEEFTVNDELRVAGTPDRVSRVPWPDPDGVVANRIFDLKSGSVAYPGGMSQQLAVYARSYSYERLVPTSGGDLALAKREALPDVNTDWGVIAHLPQGEGVCTLYWLDLRIGWRSVETSVAVRELKREWKKLLVPIAS